VQQAQTAPADQIASAFGRWVFPNAGVEVYGEFGREDYNSDLHDLINEPDHDASYMIGLQRVWRRHASRMAALRVEVLNSRQTNLALVRPESPFYIHGDVVQGFTERGQAIGSAAAFGGGGAQLAFDWYDSGGTWTVSWDRLMLGERRPGVLTDATQPVSDADVMHAFGAKVVRYRRRFDVTLGLTEVLELNGAPGSTTWSTRFTLGITGR
jgi:hypothetical protein